jgi:hypothetical protein
MTLAHDFVTLEVTRYMRATGINQETMAAAIGLQQSVLSKKILGLRRWSLADLDRLADAGVPIHLTATTLDREARS